ncbi:protease inhibitor I9 family protein [Sporosarcina sp. NPDC096371]|uniref:protease inhibitor I9 family protein n=1 Tax=Sporosarcina sp. NPDC096371 TaxID=3364530 RepID=UPI00382314FE
MSTPIYVDPLIDLTSQKTVSIIIQFKTKLARLAVLDAQANGQTLSLEQAQKAVDDAHIRFYNEMETLLDAVPYTITRSFKIAYNGVAMELPANEINRLLKSTEISSIHADKEIRLNPPTMPFGQM